MGPRNGWLCAVGVAALVAAGCGDDESNDDTAGSTQAPAASESTGAPSAKVEFVAPGDGTTVGDKFTAKVKLENFEIDPDSVGKSPVPGKGHLHFQMDGGKFDIPENSGENGKLAQKLGVDGKYSPSVEPTITYENMPPGDHTLKVFLANNNHTPTGAEAETEFTVK